MDGMLHFGGPTDAEGRITPSLGILYAEDFDDTPQAPPPAPEPAPVAAPAPPALTQADVERACTEAVAEARGRWEQEGARQLQRTLHAVAEALTAARDEAERCATGLAEGTVTTMLGMLRGALPHLCRDHGPAEARALVHQLLPTLRAEPHITIRVHPSLAARLQEELARDELELTGALTVTPAPLEPGDVRVTWENGSCKRDTRAILAAMQDALAQLGLLNPIDITTTPERRLALAQ